MKIVRLQQLIAMTGLARSTIYKLMGDNKFPKSVTLGCRSVGWIEEEVQQWLSEKVEARQDPRRSNRTLDLNPRSTPKALQ